MSGGFFDAEHMYIVTDANQLALNMQSNVRKGILECAEEIPDAADALCGMWGVIAPAIIQEVFSLIAEQLPGVVEANSPHFNWLDSFALTAQGVSQLADKETHRPATTKLKGFINISAGISLGVVTGLAISAVGVITLATAAHTLAATMGATTLLSCDETVRAARRGLSAEYWLVDSLKQLEKLQSVSIAKQTAKLQDRQQQYDELRAKHPGADLTRKEKALQWAILRADKKLKSLQEKESSLLNVIQTRITTNKTCHDYYIKNYDKDLFNPLKKIGVPPDLELDHTSARAKTFEKAIHSKNREAFAKALMTTLYVGLLFTGTLLLCFPGAQIPGAICLGIFAAAFLAKNKHMPAAMASSAMSGAKKVFNQLFRTNQPGYSDGYSRLGPSFGH